jgi:anaerobic magnesium-protoporphyrin IX monomethyl ester cyclase
MQVLLLRPPRRHPREPGLSVPPMGLAYIAASLESAGHRVRIIDAYAERWSWQQTQQEIERMRPDILGLSAMTPTADVAARAIREARPYARYIVMGGPHPTAVGETIFEQIPELDAAVIGEGEDSVVELLQWWKSGAKGQPPEGVRVPGYAYQARSQPPDIHRIPMPARHLLPSSSYRYLFATRPGFTTLISSRGCPFRCSFCDKSVSGSRWRARSPRDVVDEMEMVVRDHGVGFINFYDDNFTLRRERVVAICEEIIRRDLKIEWKCEGRVDSVDIELLELMRRAGCRCIAYGVESGHQPTLELLRKDIDLAQVRTAFEATRSAGIRSLAYMILGAPGESQRDVTDSVEFCREIRADYVQFSTLVAMPGTPLFHLSEKHRRPGVAGPMDRDLSRETLTDLPEEVLASMLRQAWTGFYLRPRPMARLLRDAWSSGSMGEALYLGRAMGRWLGSSRSTGERSAPEARP